MQISPLSASSPMEPNISLSSDRLTADGQIGTKCLFQPCGGCTERAEISTQKPDAHNFLGLIHKRHAIKTKLNLWHDRLVVRLPMEIVSRIFLFFDRPDENDRRLGYQSSDNFLWEPLFLSRVCRRWRDIALTTPQLWTNVTIDVWAHSIELDFTKEILFRSRSLPLHLTLVGDEHLPEDFDLSLDPITSVIRSHSARWESLNIQYAPDEFIHKLLHNLDNLPTSDYFDLQTGYMESLDPVTLSEPFRPKRFYTRLLVTAAQIPLEWGNITELDVSNVQMSTLLNIVLEMPRLTKWISKGVTADPSLFEGPIYRMPTAPIELRSVKHLELVFSRGEIDFFRYVTLPSLLHLQCHLFSHYDTYNTFEFKDLIDFFGRSELDSTSLETFDVKYPIYAPSNHPELVDLKGVTHLSIVFFKPIRVISSFLSRMSNISVLPRLRELRIEAPDMGYHSWALLSDIFQIKSDLGAETSSSSRPESSRHAATINCQHALDNTSTSRSCIPGPLYSRPLTLVSLDIERRTSISRDTFSRFQEVQRAGVVKLEFIDSRNQDVLQRMARAYGDSE